MANAMVYNDNVHDFKSIFKGDKVFIKAKGYWLDDSGKPKVMDLYEANDFRGTYHPVAVDGSGVPDPKSYKMIKIEMIKEAAKQEMQSHVCMQCKHSSPSPEELEAHINVRHADAVKLGLPDVDVKKPRGRPVGS